VIDPTLAASAAASALNLLGAATDAAGKPAATTPNDLVKQADFLQLLVAQLQNQDPLNPLDSANFSAQLAQFSSLQQLVEINQRLAAEAGGGASGPQRFDALSLLGKEVRGAGATIAVEGGTASTLEYTLDRAAVVQATILDAGGRQVASLVLGAAGTGAQRFDLSNIPDAPRLADGTYTVRLAAANGAGEIDAIDTIMNGRVTGIDLAGDAPVLLLGDRRLALADVTQIREPAAEPAA
jgi:flagellar basal-body rod modification protein FlgD